MFYFEYPPEKILEEVVEFIEIIPEEIGGGISEISELDYRILGGEGKKKKREGFIIQFSYDGVEYRVKLKRNNDGRDCKISVEQKDPWRRVGWPERIESYLERKLKEEII